MESIPMEVTAHILWMLPARSLLRCRSVCKTWRNQIDEPQFASLHFDREIKSIGNKTQTRFFLRHFTRDELAIYIVEQQESPNLVFKCTKMSPIAQATVSPYDLLSLTAVNGLFSVSEYRGHTFLCNPFTGEFLMLPELQFQSGRVTPGFGYDKLNKVFKVVQMFYPRDFSGTEAHVYTLGSNSSWKKLANAPNVVCRRSGVDVNGYLHWLPNKSSSMLSFDLTSENFGGVTLPDLGSSSHGLCIVLNVDGCLSILELNDGIELWVMKEYGVRESWIKVVVSRTNVETGASLMSIQPISFWKDGEILLVCDSRILVSYNVESGRYTPVEIIGLPDCNSFEVFHYCGNLLPLRIQLEESMETKDSSAEWA